MKEILNCWDYKSCGCEPGGERVDEHGVCPAATNRQYHGVNRGKAGGRFCWNISGTPCSETADEKPAVCTDCSFYQEVERQEGRFFVVKPHDLGQCPGKGSQTYVVLETRPDPISSARWASETNAPPAV